VMLIFGGGMLLLVRRGAVATRASDKTDKTLRSPIVK